MARRKSREGSFWIGCVAGVTSSDSVTRSSATLSDAVDSTQSASKPQPPLAFCGELLQEVIDMALEKSDFHSNIEKLCSFVFSPTAYSGDSTGFYHAVESMGRAMFRLQEERNLFLVLVTLCKLGLRGLAGPSVSAVDDAFGVISGSLTVLEDLLQVKAVWGPYVLSHSLCSPLA